MRHDVTEERAAALIDENGRRSYIEYDDIGCMPTTSDAIEGRTIVERYVHDWESHEWIAADQAAFLMADPHRESVRADGIGHCGVRRSGQTRARQDCGAGRRMDCREVVERPGRRWMDER